jgi:signal transduction histidine kinase
MTPEHNKASGGLRAATARSRAGRLVALVRPKKTDEDERRLETLVNTILLASTGLLVLLFSTIVYNSFETDNYGGVTITSFGLIILAFVALFIASRKGFARFVSCVLVAIYFAGSFYCGWEWGASLPATLLSFTLVIVMANLLFGMRGGMAVMLVSFGALVYLTIHEMNMPQIIDWKNDPIEVTDIIAYLFIIGFMFVLSWISRRQTDASLVRARSSEKELARERDSLEVKVRERTDELRRTQEDRIRELSRIAEFGRLSQGVFHDLLSPLSSMLLHIERMSAIPRQEVRDARDSLEKISIAGKRFGAYLSTIRSTISSKKSSGTSVFAEELQHTLNLLSFKARERSVGFVIRDELLGRISIEPILIHQILLNLISNAIDSYDTVADKEKRSVTIIGTRENGMIRMSVSDEGCGIDPAHVSQIFEPFFTTKAAGTGIGLSSVKRLLDEMHGTISVKSIPGKGTIVTVTIPI